MNNLKNPWEHLVAKDLWAEYRYLADGSLASLEEGRGLRLYRPDGALFLEGSIGSTLAPGGGSFASLDQQIFALQTEPTALVHWNMPDARKNALLTFDGKVGCLQVKAAAPPLPSWVSWIAQASDGSYQSWVRIVSGNAQLFWTFSGVPFAFAWHPAKQICLAIVVPREGLPWEHAQLQLASYDMRGQGPSLLEETCLRPPAPGTGPCLEAQFSPAGDAIIGLWRTGEWYQLWSVLLSSQRWTQLSFTASEKALPRRRFDTHNFFLRSAKEIISLSQERGFFKLDRWDLQTKNREPTSPLSTFYTSLRQLRQSPESDAFSLIASSANEPPTLLEARCSDEKWTITAPLGRIPQPPGPKLLAEALSWPSFDGHTVHGILYRDPRRQGPLPLILPIHGGPTEQVSASWPVKAQAFVQKGYAVLYVNYRGSWGYGHSYQQALAGRWGEADVLDVLSSLKSLAAAGWIDPKRVGLWGGDIGGSLVLRLLQRHPQFFKAAVVVYPIYDFHDYFERCSPLAKAEISWALGSKDKKTLDERSPLYARHQIKTPLLLFHGGRDKLVPLAHSESLASSLASRDVPCWFKVYAEEGHSWRSRTTLEDYYCRVESFLARFLRRET